MRLFLCSCGDTYREQHAAAYRLLSKACGFCGFDVTEDDILKTDKGKPYFRSRPDIFFSIAHTEGHAVCLIGDTPCGTDAEKISRKIPHRVSERYLSGAEGKEALRLWTVKESYGKAEGSGFLQAGDIPEGTFFGFFEQDGCLITVCTLKECGSAEVYTEKDGSFMPCGRIFLKPCAAQMLPR